MSDIYTHSRVIYYQDTGKVCVRSIPYIGEPKDLPHRTLSEGMDLGELSAKCLESMFSDVVKNSNLVTIFQTVKNPESGKETRLFIGKLSK